MDTIRSNKLTEPQQDPTHIYTVIINTKLPAVCPRRPCALIPVHVAASSLDHRSNQPPDLSRLACLKTDPNIREIRF